MLWRLDVNKSAATIKSRNLFELNKRSCSSRSFILLSLHFNLCGKHFHSFTRNNSWFPAYQKEATKTEWVSALPSISKSAAKLMRWRSARPISRQQKLQTTARKRGSRFTDAQRATTFNRHRNTRIPPQDKLIPEYFRLQEVFLPAALSLGVLSLQLPVWGPFKLISLRLTWGSI